MFLVSCQVLAQGLALGSCSSENGLRRITRTIIAVMHIGRRAVMQLGSRRTTSGVGVSRSVGLVSRSCGQINAHGVRFRAWSSRGYPWKLATSKPKFRRLYLRCPPAASSEAIKMTEEAWFEEFSIWFSAEVIRYTIPHSCHFRVPVRRHLFQILDHRTLVARSDASQNYVSASQT